MLPSVLPRLTTDSAGRVFPGVWKPLFLKFPFWDGLPFPGWNSLPTSFVSFFIFYIFSYLFLKTMICFSGCLMSSASIQKLFCGVCSALKCSFEEFVREKVFSLSYSSAILGLPPFGLLLLHPVDFQWLHFHYNLSKDIFKFSSLISSFTHSPHPICFFMWLISIFMPLKNCFK